MRNDKKNKTNADAEITISPRLGKSVLIELASEMVSKLPQLKSTPHGLIKEMVSNVPEGTFSDPAKTLFFGDTTDQTGAATTA